MSAAKRRKTKNANRRVSQLARLLSLLFGPARTLTLLVLLLALFSGGAYMVWRNVKEPLLRSAGYMVTPRNVEITPPPPWIHSSIREDVFRDASLDGPLSIMDDDLTDRISTAFSLHPWVAKVLRVSKYHPARVTVELVYRRPVCMVEVTDGLLPVDEQGVLLPVGDFSPIEASRYPRLVGVNTDPVGPVGTRWGDARVVGGAEIASALGPVWEQFKLHRIVPLSTGTRRATDDYVYAIFTRGGTRIIWGRAPGVNAPGELPPGEKIARLKWVAQQDGGLDNHGDSRELDVHSLRVSSLPKR
ncbi:MAG: hypothetical protein V3V75_04430 [Thermoguttaceae bacterium]